MAFELDRAGGAEVLKEVAAEAIKNLGEQLAAAAGETAVLELITTDRAKARVKVPSDLQATEGLLSKAAAEIGLEIRPSKKRPPRPRKQRSDKGKRRKNPAQ